MASWPERKTEVWNGEVKLGIEEGKRRLLLQSKCRWSIRAIPSSRETK